MAQLQEPRHSARLILRAPELSDLDDLASIYASELVNRYLYSEPRDRMQTLAVLEQHVASPRELSIDNVLFVSVVWAASNRVIGDFILKWKVDVHRQGEVGGSLHPDFQGRGLAVEVYHELLEIGFDDYHLHRIVGRCDGRNAASIRSLEKAGFHREAHLVENEFIKGEWTDEVILAIRRDQWLESTPRATVRAQTEDSPPSVV